MNAPLTRVVLVTCPNLEVARTLSKALLSDNLIACANLIPGVVSLFNWEAKINEESEVLLIIKTAQDKLGSLEKRIVELHPYDVPEFIVINPEAVSSAYEKWVATVCS